MQHCEVEYKQQEYVVFGVFRSVCWRGCTSSRTMPVSRRSRRKEGRERFKIFKR